MINFEELGQRNGKLAPSSKVHARRFPLEDKL